MAEEKTGYLTRSWKMLTHDKGWIKPLLILPLACLVPIVGAFGVMGYQFEWARFSAWDKETYPKQRDINVGACIRSGFRVFVVFLVYGLIMLPVDAFLLSSAYFGVFGRLIWGFIHALWATIAIVGALRATIYKKVAAGLQPTHIFELLKGDFENIARFSLLGFCCAILIKGITTVLFFLLLLPSLEPLYYIIGGSPIDAEYMLVRLIGNMTPWIVIIIYVASMLFLAVETIIINAVGLWMARFNVSSWHGYKDPLPEVGQAVAESQERDGEQGSEKDVVTASMQTPLSHQENTESSTEFVVTEVVASTADEKSQSDDQLLSEQEADTEENGPNSSDQKELETSQED